MFVLKNMLQQIKGGVILMGVCAAIVACEHQPPVKNTNGSGNNDTTTTSIKCSPDTVYFVNEILPLLNSNCAQAGCHDAGSRQDGVQLDNYSNILSTGKIRPGQPNEGDFMKVITSSDPDKRMPPAGNLTQDQINKLRKWIEQGARNNACRSACDSTVFTYSGAISKIINTNCVACHSSGNVLLNSYAGVKARVDDGRFWGAVKHLPGYQAMPNANTFLSACDLDKIQKWIAAGSPNN